MPGDIVTVIAYLQAESKTTNNYTGHTEARTQWTIPAFQANAYPVNLYAEPKLTDQLKPGDKRPHQITLECEYLLRIQNGQERDHRRYYNYRWKLLAVDDPQREVTQTLPPTPLRQKANPQAGVGQPPPEPDSVPLDSHQSHTHARLQAVRIAATAGSYDLADPADQERFTKAVDWLTHFLLNPDPPPETPPS